MPKVKLGKETVKFLAIFDHLPMRLFILYSLFSLFPPVRSFLPF